MNGILLINKPEGWTSFDVVNYVRKMVARLEGKKPRQVKVGHTGTLDPAATGLLVLCVGKATKEVPLLMKQDKTYTVELTLGKVSSTQDKEGEIVEGDSRIPDKDEVLTAIGSFIGESMQIPPAFSALKVNGKRAYDLARAGKEVVLEARPVRIDRIDDIVYDYPYVRFVARVGSGTYIRSLARDIGEKLGCGAYMSALCRTEIGTRTLDEAYAISALTEELLEKTLV